MQTIEELTGEQKEQAEGRKIQVTHDLSSDLKMSHMTLSMGPSHPATHGTVRFVLELDGESVVKADVEVGYLHRGFEKSCESHTWNQAVIYTDRLNYVSPLINNVGYALAVEKLFDMDVTERCKYIRVIVSELSRLTDHLTNIAAISMELGALTAFLYFMKAREYMYELVEAITGGRITPTYTRIGGVAHDLPENFDAAVHEQIKKVRKVLREVDGLLSKNRIFMERTAGTGKISVEDAISYGFTGPCLRAGGVAYDVRKASPYLVYDRLNFDVPVGENGDNYDRYLVRMEEMEQSLRILEQCIKQIPQGAVCVDDPRVTLPPKQEVYTNIEALMNHFKLIMPGHGITPPKGEAYFAVEGANGELGFYVVSDEKDMPYKVRVRPPCFCIMSGLHKMIEGGMLADIVPSFGSVNMIGGECDR